MKTFGLYLFLFFVMTMIIAVNFKEWKTSEIILQSTIFSYIVYRLIKDEDKD